MDSKIVCEYCENDKFDYDSYWKEYSCSSCGRILGDDSKIKILDEAQKKTAIEDSSSASTEEYNKKESLKGIPDKITTDDQAKDLYKFAIDLARSEDYERAAELLYKIKNEYREHGIINFFVLREQLAQVLIDLKRFDEAKGIVEENMDGLEMGLSNLPEYLKRPGKPYLWHLADCKGDYIKAQERRRDEKRGLT